MRIAISPHIVVISLHKVLGFCQSVNSRPLASSRFSPQRFLGYAPVPLQFPELAAEQLEQSMTQLGLVGAGTDYAVPWVKDPVDHVLNTPGLTDPERIAILGGNAAKLMKLPV
jgi:hypothetical protein